MRPQNKLPTETNAEAKTPHLTTQNGQKSYAEQEKFLRAQVKLLSLAADRKGKCTNKEIDRINQTLADVTIATIRTIIFEDRECTIATSDPHVFTKLTAAEIVLNAPLDQINLNFPVFEDELLDEKIQNANQRSFINAMIECRKKAESNPKDLPEAICTLHYLDYSKKQAEIKHGIRLICTPKDRYVKSKAQAMGITETFIDYQIPQHNLKCTIPAVSNNTATERTVTTPGASAPKIEPEAAIPFKPKYQLAKSATPIRHTQTIFNLVESGLPTVREIEQYILGVNPDDFDDCDFEKFKLSL